MSEQRPILHIRVRLTLWYVLLLAIVLVLFGGAVYLALGYTRYNDVDTILRSSAALLAGAVEIDAQGQLRTTWSDPQQGEHVWRVLAPSGEVVIFSSGPAAGALPHDQATIATALDRGEIFQTARVDDEPVRLYTAPVVRGEKVVGFVQVGLSVDDLQETLTAFRWILVLAVPVTLAMASVGGLFLAGRALRPVDGITRAARSISARDLSQRLDLDLPDDELGRLARTFDAMMERLDQAFQRQRRFTADASHELRTPLTVIKGDLSLALARPRDAEAYRRVIAEVDREVDQISRLVERLLALARADAEGFTLDRRLVDLSPLLADLVEQMRPSAEAKGLELTARIPLELTASVDVDALTQVILNLLDNGVKYTPSPGYVGLSAERARSELRIGVADSGPGIPAEHLPHIFDRFYRVDPARSRELGGAGLGLAIARELARAHGGDLTVHSVPGEGSTFTLRLPLE
jgi:heavy metal sensor kinase